MRNIIDIISTFSHENKTEFLQYLVKKNRRGDTKNTQLFKLIANGNTTNLDIKLYGKPARNAYHALCKRLQDSLIDFVATNSFAQETSEEMEIFKLLLASRIFFENKKHKIAFKTLSKAEKIALNLDVFTILSEIYHTKIQYHHLQSNYQLDDVIKQSQRNAANLQQEQKLNMSYAAIKARLKKNRRAPINELIIHTFYEFDIQLDQSLTFKSLYQLLHITTTAARLQSNYYPITPFMMEIYEVLKKKEDVAQKHLYYHIEILNLMAQTSFRNKDFEPSFMFLEKMELEMSKKNGSYYPLFHEKLTLLKALNLNYTNQPAKALETLNQFANASQDINLTLVMIYFQQEQYDKAYQILKKMYHSDSWYEKKSGWIWVLKKSIMEILVLIELDKLDLVLLRANSFQRKFKVQLIESGEERVIHFVKLIMAVYEDPAITQSLKFQKKVENSFEWKEEGHEDIFVMSFYAWLKSKMTNTPIYTTTLQLAGYSKL